MEIGKLYVVATPIGNMDDLTTRAVHVLSSVDIIAAEDTRTTGILLSKIGIKSKLISCHKFNEQARLNMLSDLLLEGKNIALVSDAGTPCVSDPGYMVVARAIEVGAEVVGICGANAAITAVSICGFDTREFFFWGFIPRDNGELKMKFADFATIGGTIIFYESPKRIKSTTLVLEQTIPGARVCLCNDLTKIYEKIYRGTPFEVLAMLNDNPHSEKGEYTCVVHCNAVKSDTRDENSVEAMLVDIIIHEDISLKEAINALRTRNPDISKKIIYNAALRLKEIFHVDDD